MRAKLIRFTIIIVIFTFGGENIQAQLSTAEWTEIKYPPTTLNTLIESKGKLFAGTESGVYLSVDSGLSWKAINMGLPSNIKVRAFALISDNLLIGTDKGIWRSPNEGQTWSEANTPLTANQSVIALAAKQSDLFVGTENNPNGNIFRSNDLGVTWSLINKGIDTNSFGVTKFANVANTLLIMADNKLYQSSDDGNNWSPIKLPTNLQLANNFAASGALLFISGKDIFSSTDYSRSVIWRSIDQGSSWEKIAAVDYIFGLSQITELIAIGANVFAIGTTVDSQKTIISDFRYSPDGGQYFIDNGPPRDRGKQIASTFSKLFVTGGRVYVFQGLNVSSGFYRSNPFFAPAIATVSAADFNPRRITSGGLVSIFGNGIAVTTKSATSLPLPEILENILIKVKDSLGNERNAPLLYVSPTQINFQIPASTTLGVAKVTVYLYNQEVGTDAIVINQVAPSLFSINMNGAGIAAAGIQRVRNDGTSIYEAIAKYDAIQNQFIAIPINVSSSSEQVFLNLYGTGIRGRSDIAKVKAVIGGVEVPVTYAGSHGSFVGVDQVNILLPTSLAGKGEVDVVLTVDNQIANPVKIVIQ